MGNKIAPANNTNHRFIIHFNRNSSVHHSSDASSCNKRVIFVSLIGLFQTYRKCPAHILYSALFVLPLKRRWIYCPSKYMIEIQSVSSGLIRAGLGFDSADYYQFQEFLELLKWKDSQGFVFWAKEEYKITSFSHKHMHPFWQFVSHKLVTLYDPITCAHYKPLMLNSKYCDIPIDMLSELYCLTLKYETMKKLILASNPKSFRVVTAYNDDDLYAMDPPQFIMYPQLDEEASDVRSDDEWWISAEY